MCAVGRPSVDRRLDKTWRPSEQVGHPLHSCLILTNGALVLHFILADVGSLCMSIGPCDRAINGSEYRRFPGLSINLVDAPIYTIAALFLLLHFSRTFSFPSYTTIFGHYVSAEASWPTECVC